MIYKSSLVFHTGFMKTPLQLLPFLLAITFSACGGPAEQDAAEAQEEADWAAEDAAADAKHAEYMAWATSDDRPVNRACNEPDYSRGQSETYIGLHSPLYPAIEAKNEFLIARLKELTPKVDDPDIYDVEAYNDVKYDMMMIGQWTFMLGIDNAMKLRTLSCNHEQYNANKCTLMARMAGPNFSIENIETDGDILRYSPIDTAQSLRADIELKNADLDGVKIDSRKGDIPILRGEWIREPDGTERVSASAGPRETYSYTENPDCSGTARWTRPQDNGGQELLSFTWSSVRKAPFTMSYSHCKENDLRERVCKDGGF